MLKPLYKHVYMAGQEELRQQGRPHTLRRLRAETVALLFLMLFLLVSAYGLYLGTMKVLILVDGAEGGRGPAHLASLQGARGMASKRVSTWTCEGTNSVSVPTSLRAPY